jgi:hypothetical protein
VNGVLILLLETLSDSVFLWVTVDLMLPSWLFRRVVSDVFLAA